MGKLLDSYTITKKYNFWWRDKERGFKIRCNDLDIFEHLLMARYKLKTSGDLRCNKMNVSVYYGLRLERGTFLIRVKGNLSKIFLELLDLVAGRVG